MTYYVIRKGRKTGIFTDRNQVKNFVSGYPQAKYKKFDTQLEAEKAFQQGRESFYAKKEKKSDDTHEKNTIKEAIAVDAACSGNPGVMEFRGIDLVTQQEVFHYTFPLGTNNIGEFLALVEGIKYVQNGHENYVIYSDSRIALNRIPQKKCKTLMTKEKIGDKLFKKIQEAEEFLKKQSSFPQMIKRNTEERGEIPADFGRK
ncbi:viroplasmin family protein [bacterium]|nr:viroplasmin family protein [bacterium]